jgi:hypothetical protein
MVMHSYLGEIFNSEALFCRISNNGMVAMQTFSLAFGLITIKNKELELGM